MTADPSDHCGHNYRTTTNRWQPQGAAYPDALELNRVRTRSGSMSIWGQLVKLPGAVVPPRANQRYCCKSVTVGTRAIDMPTYFVLRHQLHAASYIHTCMCTGGSYLAKSSLSRRTNSSAVHWSDRLVKPQISANRMLQHSACVIIQQHWRSVY